jgi:hypothetical protein
MKYREYTYLWPPRPEVKVPRDLLSHYEREGWHAQVKKNGTCTVIFARGSEVIFKTRHDDDHKMWTPKREHAAFFVGPPTWNVFVAELLHSKTPYIKDQLYIFDQIVRDGVHLVGTTFRDRQSMLRERWPQQVSEPTQLRIGEHVSLAKNFKAGFDKLFDNLKPEDEGLVLKQPAAKLAPCFKHDSNNAWQVKSRIPHKNYGF